MDTATKTRIDAAKTASKRVVQKTTDAAAGLTGNKIADKNTPASKTNTNTKELQQNERHKIYIPPEKRWFMDDLTLFLALYKNGIPKN